MVAQRRITPSPPSPTTVNFRPVDPDARIGAGTVAHIAGNRALNRQVDGALEAIIYAQRRAELVAMSNASRVNESDATLLVAQSAQRDLDIAGASASANVSVGEGNASSRAPHHVARDEIDIGRLDAARSTGVFGQTQYTGAEERAIEVMLNIPGAGSRTNVVAEANRIFGFTGWSNRIIGFQVHDAHFDNEGWHVCASASVAVVLKNGVEHQDCGTGEYSHPTSKGIAIIRAQRIAIDDALKRAMRKFGIFFDISA